MRHDLPGLSYLRGRVSVTNLLVLALSLLWTDLAGAPAMSEWQDAVRAAMCRHERHDEPDEFGDALCFQCEQVTMVKLTDAGFRRDMVRLSECLLRGVRP